MEIKKNHNEKVKQVEFHNDKKKWKYGKEKSKEMKKCGRNMEIDKCYYEKEKSHHWKSKKVIRIRKK